MSDTNTQNNQVTTSWGNSECFNSSQIYNLQTHHSLILSHIRHGGSQKKRLQSTYYVISSEMRQATNERATVSSSSTKVALKQHCVTLCSTTHRSSAKGSQQSSSPEDSWAVGIYRKSTRIMMPRGWNISFRLLPTCSDGSVVVENLNAFGWLQTTHSAQTCRVAAGEKLIEKMIHHILQPGSGEEKKGEKSWFGCWSIWMLTHLNLLTGEDLYWCIWFVWLCYLYRPNN